MHFLLVSLGFTVIGFILATSVIQRPQHPHSGLIPGPFTWPLLGTVGTFYRLLKYPEQTLQELGDLYGDICLLKLGLCSVVIVNKVTAANELLHRHASLTASRPEHNDLRYSLGKGRLVFTPAGQDLRILRKVYHKMLGQHRMTLLRRINDRESVNFMIKLLNQPENFYVGANRYALNVIFSAIYGSRLASLEHSAILKLTEIWDALLPYVHPGTIMPPDVFPILLQLPRKMQPWYVFAQRLTSKELRIHDDLIKRMVREDFKDSQEQCYGQILIQMKEEGDLPADMFLGALAFLAIAGGDTTSIVLQNFFKTMALHPDVVQVAQKELDSVVGRDRLPTWNDQIELPYIRAMIKEIHRWSPIGCLGVAHGTTGPFTYQSCHIPTGSIIIPNLVTLHRDPARYTQPDAFDPTRFLGDSNDAFTSSTKSSFQDRDHFHYGFGRRLCLGINIAEDSLFIVISRILWMFDLKMLENEKLSMMDRTYSFTVRQKPFKMDIKLRDEAARTVVLNEKATQCKTTYI